MNCQNCRHELEHLHAADAAGAAVQAHLENCAQCRAFCAEQSALKRLLRELTPVVAPPDFDFRLRARMASGVVEKPSRSRRFGFAPSAMSLGFAAAFVCAVFFARHWSDSSSVPQSSDSSAVASTAMIAPNIRIEAPGIVKQRSTSESKRVRLNSVNSQEVAAARTTSRSLKVSKSFTPQRRIFTKAGEMSESTPRLVATKSGGRGEPTSSDSSVRGISAVSSGTGGTPRESSFASMTFAVQGATAPLRIIWRSPEGATRSASIAPFGFGAQDLPSGDRRTTTVPRHRPVGEQGVW